MDGIVARGLLDGGTLRSGDEALRKRVVALVRAASPGELLLTLGGPRSLSKTDVRADEEGKASSTCFFSGRTRLGDCEPDGLPERIRGV